LNTASGLLASKTLKELSEELVVFLIEKIQKAEGKLILV